MLNVMYKDGTRRILNVPTNFYLDGKTGETISRSFITDKVTDLLSDLGPYKEVYKATLFAGPKLLVDIGPNPHNLPVSMMEPEVPIDESLQIKEMKKDTKGFVYTQRILRNSDGVFVTSINEPVR